MPRIWCSWEPNGNIKAEYMDLTVLRSVTIDIQTGNVIRQYNAKEGTDAFRWLVTEARRHRSLG